jgi:hypothetical protein
VNDVLDAVADVVFALDAMLTAIRRYGKRAVRLRMIVTLDGVPTVQFPDNKIVDAALTFSDKFGDAAPEPAPVTWAVSDSALASITPDPTDDTLAKVQALAGTGTFHVTATSGTLTGQSEDLIITPGAAVSGHIAVTLEP